MPRKIKFSSPSFSVDPSFPTESKADQLVNYFVYPLSTWLAALLQVSKLSQPRED